MFNFTEAMEKFEFILDAEETSVAMVSSYLPAIRKFCKWCKHCHIEYVEEITPKS